MKPRPHPLSFSIVVCLSLLGLMLMAELLLVMLTNGSTPNRLHAPVMRFWPMFNNLVLDHPWESLEMLAGQAFVVIRHADAGATIMWALYFYPSKLLVALLVAVMISIALVRNQTADKRVAVGRLVAGVLLLLIAVSYMQLSSCCSGPTWIIDLGLRVLADPANPNGNLWHALYPRHPAAFDVLRTIMVVVGFWLTITALNRKRSGYPRLA